MLKDVAQKYYFAENFNCAETIVRAANEYYDLGLHSEDMKLVAGFGAGCQTGGPCGAYLSAISILSMKYVALRAHESADIRPVSIKLTQKFKGKYSSILCRDIKMQSFQPQVRCLYTVEAACDALEETIAEYEAAKAN